MVRNNLKRGLKHLLSLGGYHIINKTQFGNDILTDIKTIFQPAKKLTLFDIGANLGQTSLEFVKAFPKSRIYSFEPDPDTYSGLVKETKTYSEIKTFNIGFGEQKARLQMNINKGSGGSSILPVSDKIKEVASGDWTECIGQREVEITTLNSFCEEQSIKYIDLLKMDTQGYELRILEGGNSIVTPSVTKAIFIEVLFAELYKEQAYFHDIYKILTDRGFKLAGLYNKFHKTEPPHYLLWCDALFVSDAL
jgi:FkbM family methyltransferase